MTTVSGIAAALKGKLDNASYLALSTRVLLKTGVNLRDPKPHQDADAGVVAKVTKALTDMGHAV